MYTFIRTFYKPDTIYLHRSTYS